MQENKFPVIIHGSGVGRLSLLSHDLRWDCGCQTFLSCLAPWSEVAPRLSKYSSSERQFSNPCKLWQTHTFLTIHESSEGLGCSGSLLKDCGGFLWTVLPHHQTKQDPVCSWAQGGSWSSRNYFVTFSLSRALGHTAAATATPLCCKAFGGANLAMELQWNQRTDILETANSRRGIVFPEVASRHIRDGEASYKRDADYKTIPLYPWCCFLKGFSQ